MFATRTPSDPRRFGRRQPYTNEAAVISVPAVSDDLKLFAATYAAGFLFVSIFLA